MTVSRLFAIGFIYVCAALAWGVLGGSLVARSGESDTRLSREVALLWGGKHVQVAPAARLERPGTRTEQIQERDEQGRVLNREVTKATVERVTIPLDSSRVDVALRLDQRQKGLLWYDTYGVQFHGSWRVHNPDAVNRRLIINFAFPSPDAIYDGFVFKVGSEPPRPVTDLSRGVDSAVDVPPGAEVPIEISYTSRGLGDWTYAFAAQGVAPVRDFRLQLKTDFETIDFPAGHDVAERQVQGGHGMAADLALRQPGERPAHRDGSAQSRQPRPPRRTHHVVRSGLAALLPRGHGDTRHPARLQPAPHELCLRCGGLLLLPPVARLPRGPPRLHLSFAIAAVPASRWSSHTSGSSAGRDSRYARPDWRSSCSWFSSATRSSSRATRD